MHYSSYWDAARADRLDRLRLQAGLGLAGPEMTTRSASASQSRFRYEPVRKEKRLRRRRPAGAVPLRGPWPAQVRFLG